MMTEEEAKEQRVKDRHEVRMARFALLEAQEQLKNQAEAVQRAVERVNASLKALEGPAWKNYP
jgi:hypothetical protein